MSHAFHSVTAPSHRWLSPLAFAIMCILPLSAQANSGTPLMLATGLHLVFGNLLIGTLEGVLLAFVFKQSYVKCAGWMILANYISALVGYYGLDVFLQSGIDLHLYNVERWQWVMAGVSYVLTLVLEWPFVAFCLRRKPAWFKQSLMGTLLTQTTSYLLLFGWYWLASANSMLTRAMVVSPSEITTPANVVMAYIAQRDGDVYQRRLSAGDETRLLSLHSSNRYDRVCIANGPSNSVPNHIVVRVQPGSEETARLIPITLSGIEQIEYPTDNSQIELFDAYNILQDAYGLFPTYWELPRLAQATNSDWRFRFDVYPFEGLEARNTKTKAFFRIALEMPIARWEVRNATHLPGDQVLFQLGDSQICLFDKSSGKLAVIARGRGPIALLAQPVMDTHTPTIPTVP